MDDEKTAHSRADEQEEFIVEFQDLDSDRRKRVFLRTSRPTRPTSVEDKPLMAVSLRSPRTVHQRRWRVLTLVMLVLVTVVGMLISNTSVRSLINNRLYAYFPLPTPTPSPWQETFYVEANPPWGTLAIDGREMSRLPVPGIDAPIYLAPGQHTFLWNAPPFLTRRCTFTVPQDTQSDPNICLLTIKSYSPPGQASASVKTPKSVTSSVVEVLSNVE